MSAFEELGVMPEIIRAVEEMDWFIPTPVQTEAIPLILGGGDVLAAAETGSGKTGSFALPIVQVVWEELRNIAKGTASTGGKRSQAIQLSPDDRDPTLAIEGTGLTASSNTGAWAGARATVAVVSGAHCFEVHIDQLFDAGVVRVGWAAPGARLDLGTDAGGFGFGATAKKSNARQFLSYGETYGEGDTVASYFIAGSGTVGFAKNGKDFGDAFTVPTAVSSRGMLPAICLKNARVTVNFGASQFASVPPRGCSSVCGAPRGNIVDAPKSEAGDKKGPLCIVLEPSRELAEQTHTAFQSFTKYLPSPKLNFALLVGGLPPGPQQSALQRGAEIVTGTPGRLEAFISNGSLSLSNVRFLVLDEADSLAVNNLDTIRNLYGRIPKSRLQVLLFSATLHSDEVRALSDGICRFPSWVDLKGKDAVPTTVDHAFCWVDPSAPRTVASRVQVATDGMHTTETGDAAESASEAIKRLKAQVLLKVIEAHKMPQAIIFCRTKVDCDNLEAFLNAVGGGNAGGGGKRNSFLEHEFTCTVIHSDRVQQERQANLARFKDGDARFLITTDVAARGIDISEIPFVINYTLPDNPEDYIHRVGRVGRAERKGLAISLVGKAPEKVWYHKCPSKGKQCQNRNLLEKGGCAIWYNEPQLWTAIQERLQTTVPHVDQLFRSPSLANTSLSQYGQREEKTEITSHAVALKDKVAELAVLEDNVQLSYWALRARYPPSNQAPVQKKTK